MSAWECGVEGFGGGGEFEGTTGEGDGDVVCLGYQFGGEEAMEGVADLGGCYLVEAGEVS